MTAESRTTALRIAQVAPLWASVPPTRYGGIEQVMYHLIDALSTKEHNVTLIGSGDCKTKGDLITVCPANLMRMMKDGEAYSYEHYAAMAVAEALRRSNDFDVIHFHVMPSWIPVAATTATASIFTLHTLLSNDDMRVMSKYPSVGTAGISQRQLSRMRENKRNKDIPVVYNGLDFNDFTPCFEPGRYLAFLGRMSPSKNPKGAISIAYKAGIPLLLAGEPLAGEEDYFNIEIRPRIDGKNVVWLGPLDFREKNKFLADAAALLFPIEWEEPFGMVMIEAMACGTPVLALSRGSVPEVIDNGITGFYAYSIDDLAELVGSAVSLNRRNIRRFAEGRFSHVGMAEKYIELYRRLLVHVSD